MPAKPQLLDAYKRQADAVRTVNASVLMSPTRGPGIQWSDSPVSRRRRFRPGGAAGDDSGHRPGASRRHEHLRHGQRRPGVPHLYSVKERISRWTRRQFERAIEKSNRKSPAAAHPGRAVLARNRPVSSRAVLEQMDTPPSRYYVLTVLRRSDAQTWRLRARSGLTAPICASPGSRFMGLREGLIPTSATRIGKIAAAKLRTRRRADPAGERQEPVAHVSATIHITRPQQDYQLALTITKI